MQNSHLNLHGERILSQGPLFGRLTRAGKDFLLRHGWELPTADGGEPRRRKRLAFVWPSKSGPQFGMHDSDAAHVRPFPKDWTDAFDDKLSLARAIEGTVIAPACIPFPLDEGAIESDRLYFAKHRHGAQGKSVYVYHKTDLLEWSCRSLNARDFVIQEEVVPSLYEGRKFVLRCHVLITLRDDAPLRAFLHRKSIVCQHHASTYDGGRVAVKSSQVSQAGKRHPPPILLEDLELEGAHPAARAYDKIRACGRELVEAVLKGGAAVALDVISPETTCFALLGADLLMDASGDLKVCEVNSHPALGWGTMAKVPKRVFLNLVEETLSLLLIGEKETAFDPIF